ncbi:unnamed protein product [Paramecium sonneborni]|uniref:Uncharacterized protein n=1 Tax=Paramecium sonneborni TaxID=65129 RepID=A0A8S1RT98_9CILI|nr:unnamed protein product [Paramecium sonneborni]
MNNFRVQEEPIILFSDQYFFPLSSVNNGSLVLNNLYYNENNQPNKEYVLVFALCQNGSLKNESYLCWLQNHQQIFIYTSWIFNILKLFQSNKKQLEFCLRIKSKLTFLTTMN